MEDTVQKLALPGAEIEIPIGFGQRQKIWWQRLGFGSRVYYDAAVFNAISEAMTAGLIVPKKYDKRQNLGGHVGKRNTLFTFKESYVIGESLKVYFEDKLVSPDLYAFIQPNALSFLVAPETRPLATYSYLDNFIHKSITEVTTTAVLIYLSARNPENKTEKVFKSVAEISENLSFTEVMEILDKVNTLFGVKEEELKNSPSDQKPETGTTIVDSSATSSGTPSTGTTTSK